MAQRRIAVVTSGRQDYGLLRPLLQAILREPALELQLLVTGTHLSVSFGTTVAEIQADGLPIAALVEILAPGDDAQAVAATMARALDAFGRQFTTARPDCVVLLGDRSETLAIAAAAVVHRVPIAHIHGGEATEGAIDEVFRHAITKMALLHFAAAEPYRQRILQMGEAPERVHCVGALALDCIAGLPLPSRAELEAALGFQLAPPLFVVTFHPATLDADSDRQFEALLAALAAQADARVLFTRPNADAGGRRLNQLIDRFVAALPDRALAVAALGQRRYFGALRLATAVVGNSSSGVLEAPYLGVPTIDIGDRQRGRLAPASVLRVPAETAAIAAAIDRARDPAFRAAIATQSNPYGDGRAAERMVAVLRRATLDAAALKKPFWRAAA
jgi:UDP-hydrolysing UDP-N-acetyl-D-glucosamine 2-epimerase